MYRNLVLIGCLLCAAILIGCSKTETTVNTTTDNANKGASVTTATPAPPTSTTASTGEKIGIAECDDFITKYEACVSSKVPEIARAQYESALKQWRSSWKQLAENPQTKGTLAATCAKTKEQYEASLKTYGCKW